MDAYTIPEAAKELGVTPRELRHWIEEGRVPAYEVAGRRFVPAAEVRRVARRPPDFRGSASAGRVPPLEALRADVEELRRRVEALERDEGDPLPPGGRPALTPVPGPPGDGGR